MTSVWLTASRLAAWAPDAAREIIANAHDRDEHDEARAAEILGRVFAATGAWDLAREAFTSAADGWDAVDKARAVAVRGLAAQLPLTPFADDDDAIRHELQLVRRSLDPAAPSPVVQRTVVELRRSLEPRRVVGWLEAAFGCSPGETALLFAAAAPLLDPEIPALTAEDWEPILASASLAPYATVDRLVRLGVVMKTPVLVAAPAVVSWLLGRRQLAHPTGARLHPVTPSLRAQDLFGAQALVIDAKSVITTDASELAGGLLAHGRTLIELRPAAGASRSTMLAASVEARLNGGIPFIDFATWDEPDVQIVVDLAPCGALLPRDAALANALRGIVSA